MNVKILKLKVLFLNYVNLRERLAGKYIFSLFLIRAFYKSQTFFPAVRGLSIWVNLFCMHRTWCTAFSRDKTLFVM